MKKYVIKMPIVKYVEFETYAENENDAIERISYGDWDNSNEMWEDAEVMVENYYNCCGHYPIDDIKSITEVKE